MIAHRLQLDHTLHPGWLGPFVEGLAAGRALGRSCAGCGAVSFPPVRLCPCGSGAAEWQALSGRATIVWRTTGADGDFALARFDGAGGMATVRLAGMPEGAASGRLMASGAGGPPQICLGPSTGEGA